MTLPIYLNQLPESNWVGVLPLWLAMIRVAVFLTSAAIYEPNLPLYVRKKIAKRNIP